MQTKSRLLGFAFAAADALLELDADGKVTFCLGAGPDAATPLAGWRGRALADLLSPEDAEAVAAAVGSLGPGERSDPLSVDVACADGKSRPATLRAFQLPQLAPAVSCALNWDGPPAEGEDAGLATPSQFLDLAREALETAGGRPLGLAFVDVPGLAGEAAAARRVEGALQSVSRQGRSAARVTPERFALLHDETPDLGSLVSDAAAAEGVEVTPSVSSVTLDPGPAPVNALRALRFTIEACLRAETPADPARLFGDHLKRTLQDADRFAAMVRTRQFELHWQPIVDLSTRAVHHFEGLARFGAAGGPAPMIRLAEELDLVQAFDLAVVEKAVGRLRRPGGGTLDLAVNASALSLSSDHYVEAMLRMTAVEPALRRRLMVEVTETAAVADLEAADRRLAALRAAGVRVCIDDFGAGAASFDWLRALKVDFVKLDGGFVRRLQSDPRTSTLIAHLSALCASLGVEVVAEMIETEETATALAELGVRFGQGWLFGRASAEPALRLAEPRLRRVGAVEAWG